MIAIFPDTNILFAPSGPFYMTLTLTHKINQMALVKLLTIKELSEQMSISVSTLYKWTMDNKIPHLKFEGGAVRFDPAAIEKWLKTKA